MSIVLPPIAAQTGANATAAVSYGARIGTLPPAVLIYVGDLLDVRDASTSALSLDLRSPITLALPLPVLMMRVGVVDDQTLQSWGAGPNPNPFVAWSWTKRVSHLTVPQCSTLAAQMAGEPIQRQVEVYRAFLPMVVNSTGVQQTESRRAVAVANTFAADVPRRARLAPTSVAHAQHHVASAAGGQVPR